MTHIRWMRAGVRAVMALATLALTAGAAAAQVVVSGRVTSGSQPLGGATIAVPSLNLGAITDAEGRYRLTIPGATGRTVTVIARYIGYKPARVELALSSSSVTKDFDLVRDVLNLEQVVVTGTSDATSQKKVAFSVGVVDNAQLKEAPSVSPLGGLNGRVAGATVTAVSGQPGSAPSIKLRGATSLTGSQEPLIIVDGTIARISLADINSEDIERVEVIKGAAASSLYGSDAANGVVQIFTKRGASLAENQTQVIVRNEFGASDLRRTLPNNLSHNYRLDGNGQFLLDAGGNRIPETDGISDNAYPQYFDQLGQIFQPGTFMTNYISVGQRKGTTNLNASFQNTRDFGIINLLNGYRRQNFRLNADVALTDKLDIQTGAFFARSTADQADEGLNGQAIFFGLRFLEPDVDLTAPNPDGSPYVAAIRRPPLSGNVSNPLYVAANRRVTNGRDRFTGTFKARYRPTNWLTAETNANYDRGNADFKSLTPFGFTNSVGATSQGTLFNERTSTRAYNLGATLTSVLDYKNWFTNTTKLAWVYEDQENTGLNVFATALTIGRVPEFPAASRDPNNPIIPESFTQPIRNQNYFAVTTFDIQDKLILDALIRRDQSSLFGADQRTKLFHRLSAAYRVSEDFTIPGVDEFKLRISQGTAGLRPVFDAQYEQFAIIGGSPTPITLGNPDLRPAFARETEAGFNLNFLQNYSVEYSFSFKRTTDNILNVPVSAATGYRNQWVNTGTLEGRTHEILLGAVLAQSRDFFWKVNLAGDRTRQNITEMGVPPFLVGPDEGDGNTRIFRIAPGETFGVLYGSRWIRTPEQLATTITSGRLTGSPSDYRLNEEGYFVRTADWRTVNERPLKFFDEDGNSLTQIGDVNPDFNLSFNTQATWKKFTVTAVVNWVKGGDIYNYTRQWPFNELRDPVIDQRGKPEVERKPTAYYSAFYNNFDPNEYFVENGTYVRLRELAVNWQLPESWVKPLGFRDGQTARLGLVGRNLLTSTKYTGYDPDVAGPGGGNPFAYRVDYFTYPIFRTLTAMIELGF